MWPHPRCWEHHLKSRPSHRSPPLEGQLNDRWGKQSHSLHEPKATGASSKVANSRTRTVCASSHREEIHRPPSRQVTYVGDHKPLLYLTTQLTISDKVARWLMDPLADIDYWKMVWCQGKKWLSLMRYREKKQSQIKTRSLNPARPSWHCVQQ